MEAQQLELEIQKFYKPLLDKHFIYNIRGDESFKPTEKEGKLISSLAHVLHDLWHNEDYKDRDTKDIHVILTTSD